MTKRNRRIKCFVAMALGMNDCELLYDTQMFPILDGLDLEVIRVDRREHKDDLNNFIIRMLESSDIVVADLTYARPSVYYEAGFAERQIPVVYTARKDHLSRAQADDRLRVHFDLEMKKIIPWVNPRDSSFSKKLRKRLNYFIGPLRRKIKVEKKIEIDRQSFAALSVNDKCSEILSKFEDVLRAKRFWIRYLSEYDLFSYNHYTSHRMMPFAQLSGRYGIKLVGKICFSAFVIAVESLTKKQIQEVVYRFSASNLVSREEQAGINQFRNYYFICSPRKIPISRLTSAFPDAKPSKNSGQYTLESSQGIKHISTEITIDLISTIESSTEALAAAKRATEELPREKTNRYTCLGKASELDNEEIWFRRKKFMKSNLY